MKVFAPLGLLLLFVSLPQCVQAQSSGLSFLQVGPSAESMALGDANVARSGDAYSTYWNPAGLARAERNSAALSHHIWVAELRTYSAATRLRVGRRGGLGFAVTATGTGDLEARDAPGEPAGLFSADFLSIGASYGHQVGPVRVGLTAKYLSEEIFGVSADGYALDVGAQADLAAGTVSLGAALLNVGEMSELGANATELPRTLRVGGAVFPFRVLADEDDAPLLDAFATAEVSHVFPSSSTRLHFGVGANVMELVAVRAGYITNDELRTLTFGLGLEYDPFEVDYAFVPFESGWDGPGHVMSLRYYW